VVQKVATRAPKPLRVIRCEMSFGIYFRAFKDVDVKDVDVRYYVPVTTPRVLPFSAFCNIYLITPDLLLKLDIFPEENVSSLQYSS